MIIPVLKGSCPVGSHVHSVFVSVSLLLDHPYLSHLFFCCPLLSACVLCEAVAAHRLAEHSLVEVK
jgi:hypothetical protein